MPRDRDGWIGRIKAVEREFLSARIAVDRLLQEGRRDPSILGQTIRFRDLRLANMNLEPTYLIRLFAVFEAGLRSYWSSFKDTIPLTQGFLEGIAARRSVSPESLRATHSIRVFRNALVHEQPSEVETISLDRSRKECCTYFSFLPRIW